MYVCRALSRYKNVNVFLSRPALRAQTFRVYTVFQSSSPSAYCVLYTTSQYLHDLVVHNSPFFSKPYNSKYFLFIYLFILNRMHYTSSECVRRTRKYNNNKQYTNDLVGQGDSH